MMPIPDAPSKTGPVDDDTLVPIGEDQLKDQKESDLVQAYHHRGRRLRCVVGPLLLLVAVGWFVFDAPYPRHGPHHGPHGHDGGNRAHHPNNGDTSDGPSHHNHREYRHYHHFLIRAVCLSAVLGLSALILRCRRPALDPHSDDAECQLYRRHGHGPRKGMNPRRAVMLLLAIFAVLILLQAFVAVPPPPMPPPHVSSGSNISPPHHKMRQTMTDALEYVRRVVFDLPPPPRRPMEGEAMDKNEYKEEGPMMFIMDRVKSHIRDHHRDEKHVMNDNNDNNKNDAPHFRNDGHAQRHLEHRGDVAARVGVDFINPSNDEAEWSMRRRPSRDGHPSLAKANKVVAAMMAVGGDAMEKQEQKPIMEKNGEQSQKEIVPMAGDGSAGQQQHASPSHSHVHHGRKPSHAHSQGHGHGQSPPNHQRRPDEDQRPLAEGNILSEEIPRHRLVDNTNEEKAAEKAGNGKEEGPMPARIPQHNSNHHRDSDRAMEGQSILAPWRHHSSSHSHSHGGHSGRHRDGASSSSHSLSHGHHQPQEEAEDPHHLRHFGPHFHLCLKKALRALPHDVRTTVGHMLFAGVVPPPPPPPMEQQEHRPNLYLPQRLRPHDADKKEVVIFFNQEEQHTRQDSSNALNQRRPSHMEEHNGPMPPSPPPVFVVVLVVLLLTLRLALFLAIPVVLLRCLCACRRRRAAFLAAQNNEDIEAQQLTEKQLHTKCVPEAIFVDVSNVV